ncbi:haloacid dehalogenase-like hydrolase [Solimonas soli]|uniref:haloacid dehalogenase-like hydrolase n=1 Tax=Solimonas soli TaxID=413479 RepID=UPI0004841CE5|nr:haloacid dehalogenase-like hydrolase [Solimonas soli]
MSRPARLPDSARFPHADDHSPAAALAAVREHHGALLIDLDETLYLRNSTEDFLDSARPGLLALLLLRLLDVLKPWRWTGGESTRDVWRVRVILTLLPWTLRRWWRRVPGLVRDHRNVALLEALAPAGPRAWVVTAGFAPIVAPLIEALGLDHGRVLACSLFELDDRRLGKLPRVVAALGEKSLRDSLVLTDSPDDDALLEACARPLHVVWPNALYRRALSHVYLPGQYLTLVKRPGERYILRGILQEDFAFWLLASLALAAAPLTHALGLGALLLSFWTIYELGYVDNDRIAARYEREPKLSAAFHQAPVATPVVQPWLWAAAAGSAGIWLLRWPAPPGMRDALAWAAMLLATHLWFRFYNRVDKATRVWLYPGLQAARSVAFAVIVPVCLGGAIALGAHVLARWMPYVVYRNGRSSWPEVPFHLLRLVFYVVLMLMLTLVDGPVVLCNLSAAALLVWNLFRARGELGAVLGAARRIEHAP